MKEIILLLLILLTIILIVPSIYMSITGKDIYIEFTIWTTITFYIHYHDDTLEVGRIVKT